MTGIVVWWVRDTLRLEDNPALHQAIALARSSGSRLCVIALLDPRRWAGAEHGLPRSSIHWRRYRAESLKALEAALAVYGIPLWVVSMEPNRALDEVRALGPIRAVVTDLPVAWEERLENADMAASGDRIVAVSSDDLFDPAQLPFELSDLPGSFTAFRRRVEAEPALRPHRPLALPAHWPPGCPALPAAPEWEDALADAPEVDDPSLVGGAEAASAVWQDYLKAKALSHYKVTRNAFEGRHQSSHLSPALAHGCLSVRSLWWDTLAYEAIEGANESTYWLRFELLWREYFRWYARAYDRRLFDRRGPANREISVGDGQIAFSQWTNGTTGEPIVDACMRELNATGWLSNRGRQLAASFCLAHCALDWRWGARYFESQLIDHDVASNWGNWAYIAGVGADPRGGRIFQVAAQAERYDPTGAYRARWLAQ